ncbi:MAG TPA: tRNA pseudouridine(13) synthase TruD [Pyrodictiaceae archaeon]|nr:tRNA pseudouridine(13) synthase TruD [Pyrodictiaceae archaeon]HIQ10769.1 tRNA pseudouridine(13) synthase TruD [Pyrodictium sp.]HIQ55078.1 tRNA pseudouridine(13) synthase TruD [Pyrodictium sp.]
MYCISKKPLDRLLGMYYKSLCLETRLHIIKPRTHHFLVIEQPYNIFTNSVNAKTAVYVVIKRNVSTLDAIKLIAALLRVQQRCIGYAGLKDTEATTLQYITVNLHCIRKELPKFIKIDTPAKGLWMRFVGYASVMLKPGLLHGNTFYIGVEGPHISEIKKLDNLEINLLAYYGYQRFGTRRPNTHSIGLLMLLSPSLYIRELLFEPYPDEKIETIRSRLKMKPVLEPEKTMSQLLSRIRSPQHIRPSFELLRLFASALQAYLFNRYISKRVYYYNDVKRKIGGEKWDGTRPLAPVIGEDIEQGSDAAKLYKEILEEEMLTFEDLKIFRMYGVKLTTYYRPLYTTTKLSVAIRGRKAWITFSLEKGMYATLVLRELGVEEC